MSEGLTSRCVALAGDVDPIPTLDVLAAMLEVLLLGEHLGNVFGFATP